MIELLGIGVPRSDGGWLVRELSTTFERGTVVVVGAPTPAERLAVGDVVAGLRIPVEGRAWIDRQPLMPETVRRLRRLIADIDPTVALREQRSVGWNVMVPGAPRRALDALLHLPRPGQRKAAAAALGAVGLTGRFAEPATTLSAADRVRVLLARALAHGQRHLLVRELDGAVPAHDVRLLLWFLRALSHRSGHVVIVTLADVALAAGLADRVLLLAHGREMRQRADERPSPAALAR